jgi:alanyl-tRNA synthetase
MFYDVAENGQPLTATFDEEVEKFRIMEIWNDVFMEYNKTKNGQYEKLAQQNVDTGMGLERTVSVLNGKADAFANDTFYNLINKIENLSGKQYIGADTETKKAIRIIVDHLKAATFIIGDDKGIMPSNTDQGYIVRRLIRRAIRYGRALGILQNEPWTKEIAKLVAHDYGDTYPELQKNIDKIIEELNKEEIKFSKTLERGLKEFEKEENIDGKTAFNLYQTYGFPIEMSVELAKEKGVAIDLNGFDEELKKHQELSRTASAGKFKGGLADAGEETTKLHTAAHLLLTALRKVLGDHVLQKGSNITPERLRFDFSHPEKLTDEQKQAVENLVNEAINKKLPIKCEEMDLEEAKKTGAMGVFESKYGDKVKVYTVGAGNNIFSKEICGGPHVDNTSVLGKFKIKKEESSSSGVRRIKAVLL